MSQKTNIIVLIAIIIALIAILPLSSHANWLEDSVDIALAYGTHIAVHESGHYVYARYHNMNPHIKFFKDGYTGQVVCDNVSENRQFGLGISGELASSALFEIALNSYKNNKTIYNKSLIYITNYYFLLYTSYSFLFDDKNKANDPVRVRKALNISEIELFSIVLFDTWFNHKRIHGDSNVEYSLYFNKYNDGVFYGLKYIF